jgi:hypothetical protein
MMNSERGVYGLPAATQRDNLLNAFKKFYTIAERVAKLKSPKLRYLNTVEDLDILAFQRFPPRVEAVYTVRNVSLGSGSVEPVLGPDVNLKSVKL